MADPWRAEQVVDQDLARRLIAGQFPELQLREVEFFGEGWDNTAFLVDREWVFRFPRRQIGLECFREELKALPQLCGKLSLPIPELRWLGRPGDGYPWPFAGYRLLSGVTSDRFRLSSSQRTELAAPLGLFLGRLHGLEVKGLAPDTMRRFDFEHRIREGRERLARLAPPQQRRLELRLESWAGPPSAGLPMVALHGDMYSRHLLVDDQGGLSGVIDWGDTHRGLAATDLAVAYTLLPPGSLELFLESYGEVDASTLRLARFRALTHGLGVALYARDIGDEALSHESLTALAHLAFHD